jgi:DNA-binding PadR family transcriptional regulator
MSALRRTIAGMLASGPGWARSFQLVKPEIARMVAAGEIERVRPSGGRARNMIQLTELGERRWLA